MIQSKNQPYVKPDITSIKLSLPVIKLFLNDKVITITDIMMIIDDA